MHGAFTSIPLYTFMTWCSNTDKFTSFFYVFTVEVLGLVSKKNEVY